MHNNLIIGISGKFDEKKIINIINKRFNKLEPGNKSYKPVYQWSSGFNFETKTELLLDQLNTTAFEEGVSGDILMGGTVGGAAEAGEKARFERAGACRACGAPLVRLRHQVPAADGCRGDGGARAHRCRRPSRHRD